MEEADFWAREKDKDRKPRIVTEEKEIWKMPWAAGLIEQIESNGNIEEFIKEKNQKLYEKYEAENISPLEAEKDELAKKAAQLRQSKEVSAKFNEQLNSFEKDIEGLIGKYPPERQKYMKDLLTNYARTGNFISAENKYTYTKLTERPKGFFKRIKEGKKVKEANQHLNNFIEKYQEHNLSEELKSVSQQLKNEDDMARSLQQKFENIAKIDKGKTQMSSELYEKSETRLQTQISYTEKDQQDRESRIEKLKHSFQTSEAIAAEDNLIKNFSTRIRDEIKHPKQYDAAAYIEGLEGLADNEVIMFNLRLTKEESARNILAYNGFTVGNGTKEWQLSVETRDNSDRGVCEVFSPLMTVKDAKEVMPKLIDDFDRAGITRGVIVPARAKEMFKDISKENMSQEAVDEGLRKIFIAESFKERMKDGSIVSEESQKKALSYLGVDSFDDLPKSYNSLNELSQEYPKDKYIFSGTMASDDFCQFSGRVGRTGMVYATPNIKYASLYDGATLQGGAKGISATGDYYISTAVGQHEGKDVHVGFINVYEQNPQDKFFSNFGMEDYRRGGTQKEAQRSYDLCERTPNGVVKLNRQGKTAVNCMLTREQALNGYIYRPEQFEIDGKDYFVPDYNSETFVTPEKNPLKAKIMHLSYQIEGGRYKDFYIPVPENPDEITKHILNSRQAEMKDSFRAKPNVFDRMQKQQEEFQKGIVPQIREPDFWAKKQEILNAHSQEAETTKDNPATRDTQLSTEADTNSTQLDTLQNIQSNENFEGKSPTKGRNEKLRELILQKQGRISIEPQKPVHHPSPTQNNQNNIYAMQQKTKSY